MGRLVLALCATVASSTTTVADTPLAKMKLQTYGGQPWSLADVKDSELVVFAFLGTQCPLAKKYAPRLQRLHEEFDDRGVSFVGVVSNRQDSATDIRYYVNEVGIQFPVLKDANNALADRLQARRITEVVVLKGGEQIVYQGRIDDQYLPELTRPQPTEHDLRNALNACLSGQPVKEPRTQTEGCFIGRISRVPASGDITYTQHIAPIIYDHCLECHRPKQLAPFSMASYEDLLGWEDTILEVIDEGRMPPWTAAPSHTEFKNDPRLSEEEQALIRQWVQNGMPEGDPRHLPEPPQLADGWRIPGSPDEIDVIQIFENPSDAFRVPADGIVEYKYFDVDPGWTEDKYIVAAEARPDNVAVVHHIIAYIVEPGEEKEFSRRMLVGYAPGSLPQVLDEGTAIHVKAGSKLKFEMHYTPNGSPQKDRSYIGLKFTDKKNVKKTLHGWAVANNKFTIPAGAAKHAVEKAIEVPVDQMLLDLTPHMHLRGKAFRYRLVRTDGTEEILLNVPNYDFNWQLTYKLAEPKLLKKGDTILCEALYDNSSGNPALHARIPGVPDKQQATYDADVRWGDQSFEEMMIGFLTTVDP